MIRCSSLLSSSWRREPRCDCELIRVPSLRICTRAYVLGQFAYYAPRATIVELRDKIDDSNKYVHARVSWVIIIMYMDLCRPFFFVSKKGLGTRLRKWSSQHVRSNDLEMVITKIGNIMYHTRTMYQYIRDTQYTGTSLLPKNAFW